MTTRRSIALAMVVVASVLAFASLPAIWLNRQLLNTDNYTKTSSELLADPAIRDQVAVYLVDQLYNNVDVAGELRSALPAQLQPLAPTAAGALRTLAERASQDILARPRAQQAWEDANRAAHRELLDILNGGGTVVNAHGGNVVLDLRVLLQQLAARVGVGTRVVNALPADAGQIEILRRDQLSAAQSATKGIRGLPIVLVGLSLLLFIGALFVAPAHRRNTVRGYGVGLIAAGIAMLIVISLLGDELVNRLATTAAMEPVVANTWTIITPLLQQATVAGIFYGAILVIGAWLAGPTGIATAVRRGLAPYLTEALVAWAGFAAIVAAVVVWWAPTPAMRNPVTAILLITLLAAGWEGLRRKVASEVPDASLEAAMHAHGERLRRLGRHIERRPEPVTEELPGNGAPAAGAHAASPPAEPVAAPTEPAP
jgi:hypothetical protein